MGTLATNHLSGWRRVSVRHGFQEMARAELDAADAWRMVRKVGLRGVLQSRQDGFRLDPDVPLFVVRDE